MLLLLMLILLLTGLPLLLLSWLAGLLLLLSLGLGHRCEATQSEREPHVLSLLPLIPTPAVGARPSQQVAVPTENENENVNGLRVSGE